MSYSVSDFEIIAFSLISLCFEAPDKRLGKEVAECLAAVVPSVQCCWKHGGSFKA